MDSEYMQNMENQQVMTQAIMQAPVEVAKTAVEGMREVTGSTPGAGEVPTLSMGPRTSQPGIESDHVLLESQKKVQWINEFWNEGN